MQTIDSASYPAKLHTYCINHYQFTSVSGSRKPAIKSFTPLLSDFISRVESEMPKDPLGKREVKYQAIYCGELTQSFIR